MKKIILLTIFLVGGLVTFAQQDFQEVVYLKNGSILRGTIIEQIPNQSLKIQLNDGSVFMYEIDMVEKITKEPIYNSSPYQQRQSANKDRGYEGNIYIAYGRGTGDYVAGSMQFLTKHGRRFNSHFATGFCTGLKMYFENDNISFEPTGTGYIIPVLINFKVNFLKEKVTPFISESIGMYYFCNDDDVGFNEHISFGVSFKTASGAIDLSIGYEWLPVRMRIYNYNYSYSHSIENIGGLTFGITFTW